MRIAHNPATGEYLGFQNGKWEKLRVAANKDGQKLYLGPDGWTPLNTESAATPTQATQSQGGGNLHKLGVGTRGVLKGVLDTVAFPAAAVQNAVAGMAGRPDWQAGSVGDAVSDMVGLPQAQSGDERFASRFNEGAASLIPAYLSGGLLRGGASPVTRNVGQMLQASPAMQAATGGASVSASGAVGDAGGDPMLQMAAGLVAPMAVGGLASIAPGTNVDMARAGAFQRAIGEIPSLGVVSKGGLAPILESALAKYPVTASTMEKSMGKSVQALRNAVDTAAEKAAGGVYPRTANELGQEVINAVKRAKGDALDSYSRGWDDSIAQHVNTNVPLENTVDLFANKALRRTPEAAFDRNLLAPQMESAAGREALGRGKSMLGGVWDDALNLDAASLGAVKDKRTVLMEKINGNNVADTMGVSSAEASRVTKTLRDDMFAALDQKAPDVAAKLREIDGEYAKWASKAEKVDSRITGGGREPEQVAQKLEPGPLTLGDVIRLKSLLSPQEWARIRGGIMNELPRSTQGETSAAAYATKTGKGKSAYRPEVKGELFGNDLNDADMIAQGINRIGTQTNTSNTATNLNAVNLLGGVGGVGSALVTGNHGVAAGIAASLYGIPFSAAKFLTSPAVTKAVTSPTYQSAIQEALLARFPMLTRGLMAPVMEDNQ